MRCGVPGLCGLAVLVATGCRLRFEVQPDDALDDASTSADAFGVDPGEPELPLACNTTVKLADIQPTRLKTLSAAATPSGLVASWVTETGTVGAIAVRLTTPDVADVVRLHDNLFGDAPGTRSLASVAANGSTVMVATHATGTGTTDARRFDAELTQPVGPVAVGPEFDSPHGITALDGTGDFAIAAGVSGGTTVARFRDGATSVSDAMMFPEIYGEHTLFAIPGHVALIGAQSQCEVRVVDLVGGVSVPHAWGAAGMCTGGRIAALPGTNQLMLLRVSNTAHRTSFATIAGETLSINGEQGATYFTEVDVQLAATTGTYWVARVLGEQMFFDRYFGGAFDLVMSIEPFVAPVLDHDIVTRNDEAYAIWIGSGIWIGRLCGP